MCLEVFLGFVGTFLIVPLVAVIVTYSSVVYNSIHCVHDVVIGYCSSSIGCKLLNFLNLLYKFLKGAISVPQVSQLGTVPHEVLVFYLTVLFEKVFYNAPYADVRESLIPIKYSDQECLSNRFCDLFFPGTL